MKSLQADVFWSQRGKYIWEASNQLEWLLLSTGCEQGYLPLMLYKVTLNFIKDIVKSTSEPVLCSIILSFKLKHFFITTITTATHYIDYYSHTILVSLL